MSKSSDDSEKVSRWSNGWAVFGKFMAIVTCIGAIVTIYINLFPSTPELVGHGRYTDFVVPPHIEAAHDSLKNRTASRYLYDFLKDRNSTTSRDSLFNIVSELSDSIQAGLGKDFVYSLQKYRGFVFIKIRNEGDRVASDVVFDFPSKGIARITLQDESRYVAQVARTVSLGGLRPGNNIQVEIWTESHIGEDSENGFRLTYANGIGSIAFSKRFSGYQRFIADHLVSIIFLVGVLLSPLLGWWLPELLSKIDKK